MVLKINRCFEIQTNLLLENLCSNCYKQGPQSHDTFWLLVSTWLVFSQLWNKSHMKHLYNNFCLHLLDFLLLTTKEYLCQMVFKKTVLIVTSAPADVSKNGSRCFVVCEILFCDLVQQEIAECYLKILLQGANIYWWNKKCKETGTLLSKNGSSRPKTSEESVENLWNWFLRSPKKSVHKCRHELNKSKSTIHEFSERNFKLRGYKIQYYWMLESWGREDKLKRYNFSVDLLNKNEMDQNFINRIKFNFPRFW